MKQNTIIRAIVIVLIVVTGLLTYFVFSGQQEINELKSSLKSNTKNKATPNSDPLDETGNQEKEMEATDDESTAMEIGTEPSSPGPINADIEWRSYNFDRAVTFSLEIPYVGNYCNGCLGSSSGPSMDPNIVGNAGISGGYDEPTLESNWNISINYQKKDTPSEIVLIPEVEAETIKTLPIGQKAQLQQKDVFTKDYVTVKKLDTFYIDDTEVHIVESTKKMNDESMKIAQFEKDGYNVHVIFIYDDTVEESIFNKIIGSIQFKLKEGADYP